MSLPTFFGRATAASTQHEHLAALLGKLNEAWAQLQEPKLAGSGLSQLLGELKQEMLGHFQAEEAEGYFGTLASELPALLPTIAELRADHTRLLEIVAELRAFAEDLSSAPDLTRQLAALTEQFKAHERIEAELVRTFLMRDPGFSDD